MYQKYKANNEFYLRDMTEIQLSEIRNYLLSKKLPIDILLEVQDHFVSQISDLEKEENLSFEDAFSKTKNSWENELKPFWNGSLDLEDVSDFMRKMRKEINKILIIKTVKFSFLFLLLVLVSAQILDNHWFEIFFYFIIFAAVLVPLLQFLLYNKLFFIPKKYSNYLLTIYQNNTIGFIAIIAPIMNLMQSFSTDSEKFQNILKFSTIDYSKSRVLMIVFGLFLVFAGSVFSFISQQNYLKQIQKVKPFLKYLTPSN